mmetsp:Transcript_21031/g.54321  ORF Transcript_21031/g.54321 Transcript_21031/m.54321 type:complete len:361 (+) Transcript_21031:911-1993(+)
MTVLAVKAHYASVHLELDSLLRVHVHESLANILSKNTLESNFLLANNGDILNLGGLLEVGCSLHSNERTANDNDADLVAPNGSNLLINLLGVFRYTENVDAVLVVAGDTCHPWYFSSTTSAKQYLVVADCFALVCYEILGAGIQFRYSGVKHKLDLGIVKELFLPEGHGLNRGLQRLGDLHTVVGKVLLLADKDDAAIKLLLTEGLHGRETGGTGTDDNNGGGSGVAVAAASTGLLEFRHRGRYIHDDVLVDNVQVKGVKSIKGGSISHGAVSHAERSSMGRADNPVLGHNTGNKPDSRVCALSAGGEYVALKKAGDENLLLFAGNVNLLHSTTLVPSDVTSINLDEVALRLLLFRGLRL